MILANPQDYPTHYAEYTRLFGGAPEVWRIAPTRNIPGPELRLLKVQY